MRQGDVDDRFRFELRGTSTELQGAPGGGLRVRVLARVAGNELAAFSVDLASGDEVVESPEIVVGSDLLAFANIEPVRFPIYPIAQHLAEKLHAYTLPRDRDNTRTKDLVGMITMAAMEAVDEDVLATSVAATFQSRGSHAMRESLPPPPDDWEAAFHELAAETAASPTTDLRSGYGYAVRFWDPILKDPVGARRWAPEDQAWRANGEGSAERPIDDVNEPARRWGPRDERGVSEDDERNGS